MAAEGKSGHRWWHGRRNRDSGRNHDDSGDHWRVLQRAGCHFDHRVREHRQGACDPAGFKGAAVANEIVTFSEDGGSLLKFSPESRTALTDSKGVAEVEISAATATSIGATRVKASATIATKEVSGGQNLAITSAPPTGDPQALVQAINFLDVVPSDKSIVIKGSGGNGRSETAILRFKVVDSSGSPIKDVVVDFVEATGGVQVNIAQARSNNDGIVTTSVSSKSAPTSVVVRATVNGRNVTSQSDLLTVTTGISTQRGDLSASKFNLDLDLSGDTSTLRIGIVDSNGNPVSDGVPVVATVDFGRVGSSIVAAARQSTDCARWTTRCRIRVLPTVN